MCFVGSGDGLCWGGMLQERQSTPQCRQCLHAGCKRVTGLVRVCSSGVRVCSSGVCLTGSGVNGIGVIRTSIETQSAAWLVINAGVVHAAARAAGTVQ